MNRNTPRSSWEQRADDLWAEGEGEPATWSQRLRYLIRWGITFLNFGIGMTLLFGTLVLSWTVLGTVFHAAIGVELWLWEPMSLMRFLEFVAYLAGYAVLNIGLLLLKEYISDDWWYPDDDRLLVYLQRRFGDA